MAKNTQQQPSQDQVEAAATETKAARKARKNAKRAKRAIKLYEVVQKRGLVAANTRITYREWKVGITTTIDGKPQQFLKPAEGDTSWKTYCTWKAGITAQYWMALGEKPNITEKALLRKKARLDAAREKMAKLEAELAQLAL